MKIFRRLAMLGAAWAAMKAVLGYRRARARRTVDRPLFADVPLPAVPEPPRFPEPVPPR